jgi:succinate dehydrogenase/fumarate reductase flavoprotein subunit
MDQQYDVVVIGSGITGLSAALAAAELGLRPVVFEKAAKFGGGTAASHGGLWIGMNHLELAEGYKDSRDDVVTYMNFLGGGELDQDRMLTFVDRSPEAMRFFERCGVRFRLTKGFTDHYYDKVPGTTAEGRLFEVELISADDLGEHKDSVLVWPQAPLEMTIEEKIKWGGPNDLNNWNKTLMEERRGKNLRGRGVGLITHFLKQLLNRRVPVHAGTPVDRLVTKDGRVSGVVLADGTTVMARHGVVIATGGYEANPALVETYEGLPGWLSMAPSSVAGDGLTMGMEIGAACRTIHNNIALFLGFNTPPDKPGGEHSFRLSSIGEMLCPHTIVVNRAGRRFEDESYFPSMAPALRQFVTATHSYANLPCFLIFDGQFAQRLSFAGRPVGAPIPEWVSVGDSVAALAGKLDIDASGLEATISRFNTFAQKGVDEDFHRGEKYWSTGHPIGREGVANPSLGTLAQPPFYGIELHPSAFASAGLVTNSHGQVMHQRNRPIPGLYAAGNAAAHTEYGVGYQAGHSLASGMTFGYLAVRHMLEAQAAGGAGRQKAAAVH